MYNSNSQRLLCDVQPTISPALPHAQSQVELHACVSAIAIAVLMLLLAAQSQLLPVLTAAVP